jgi:SAM-dependent methyltransferase
VTFRTHCLTCRSAALTEVVNLGMHPMADTFVSAAHASEADRVYPLICDLCADCGQIQLRTVTRPEERYVEADYSYTSSNSATSRAHWSDYARAVSGRVAPPPASSVVEIGSNDGFLSAEFAALGHRVLGVDPSPVMAAMALERGVATLTALFGEGTSREARQRLGGQARLIVANNVFNHANEPLDFVSGIRHLLAPDGTFVFELPYWLRSIEQKKFDQIYHEHVSYFTLTYADRLFRRCGMHVADVEEVDYHGGSIRVYVRHGEAALPAAARPFLDAERDAALFDPATYRAFMAEAVLSRDRFLERIYGLRAAGARLVCIGAAAKGNTFLNFYNLDSSVIDCVTDASASKQGKLTPRTRIPIEPDAVLARYSAVYGIILSWNISAMLRESLSRINPHITFLNPYEGLP